MTLSEFLEKLSHIQSPHVLYEQSLNKDEDALAQVFVGCGRWKPAAETSAENDPFLIANKGTAQRFSLGTDYTSVTRFVASPPSGYFESWHMWTQRPFAPERALASMTLVADDISPDSVMGVLLFLARLAEVDVAEIPSIWLDTIDQWEQTGVADDPWHSWCALESALVHRAVPLQTSISTPAFSRAWAEGLRFAAKCLVLNLSPINIPSIGDVPEFVQARAAMEQEQETYLDWLQHPSKLQVSLPLQGATDRRVLVDGLIVEAQQITGTTKVFFRNDRKNSSLGKGFSFAALCTPSRPGEEMNITISVDPGRGVHLREIWEALENKENRAWEQRGESRPIDHPRQMEGALTPYQQPWYIDPTGTLIGRPRKLKNGQPGSLLHWPEVCNIIWQTLNPLRSVSVIPFERGDSLALLDLKPETKHAHHNKLFFAARLGNSTEDGSPHLPSSLYRSTFFPRVLAAMLRHGRSAEPLEFSELPPLGSWDLVKLGGGFTVVAYGGIFVIDDGGGERLQLSAIRTDFHDAAILDARLCNLEERYLHPLVEDVRRLLDRKRHAPKPDALLLRAARLYMELAELRGSHALLPNDPDARLVRNELDKRWSLDRRLCTLEGEIRAIETSLRSIGDLSTLHVGRFIATYGFALVLATESAPFVAKALYHAIHAGPETDAPGTYILGCLFGIAFLLILILKGWFALEKPFKRT